MLPQVFTYQKPEVLVIDKRIVEAYLDVFLPGVSHQDRKHPGISPLYADMKSMKLPSAIFTCGTEDCLLDDTVFMASKWLMAGGEAVMKIYPGGPHGFIMFAGTENARVGMEDVVGFMRGKVV